MVEREEQMFRRRGGKGLDLLWLTKKTRQNERRWWDTPLRSDVFPQMDFSEEGFGP